MCALRHTRLAAWAAAPGSIVPPARPVSPTCPARFDCPYPRSPSVSDWRHSGDEVRRHLGRRRRTTSGAPRGRIVAAREDGQAGRRGALGARQDHRRAASSMAHEVSDRPLAREMDMLLSTGERISCALCAMAIHDMGHNAISLTGSQAGIVTDSSHTKARILDVRADRIREALGDDRIVLVAGFQGVSGDSRDVTTLGPRRLRHDRGRDRRRAGRRRLRDLHRRSRRVQRRPAARPRRAPAAASSRSRRCSRWRPRAPRCCSCARSSTPATTASPSTAAARSRTAPVPSSLSEKETMETTLGDSRDPRRRGARDPDRRPRRARRRGRRSSARSPTPT